MASWRWPRSSARSHSQATDAPSDGNLNRPPSYATLPPQAPSARSSVSLPNAADGASMRSVTSRMSQLSTPSYATHDRANRRMSSASATGTLTNPPRYPGLPGTRTGVNSGETTDQLGYSYAIRSVFKSEPWATLRLYDVGPASRTSKRGRHPRFSSKDVMLGHVELSLSNPQIIKNIELALKGNIITGSIGEGGTMAFLVHPYTLWDRKFGGPHHLAHNHVQPPSGKDYDGKLSGSWVFPFAIPFPTRVELATLRAVYEEGTEGPVRFLPERLYADQADAGHATGQQRYSDEYGAPRRSSDITPFDIRSADGSTEPTTSHFVPIAPIVPAPTIPSIEPYSLQQSSTSSSSRPPYASSGKRDPAVLLQPTQSTPSHLRHRGATPMHDPESQSSMASHALPQSFLERDVVASIHYELILTITHGRFSTKSRVKATVIYEPTTSPPSITLARQMAYRRREIPPGPAPDPDGWRRLPPVSIIGTYLDQRELTVQYTLFLAKPLSYARGTVLPCCLTIACDDVSALDLLANPRTPRVRLQRFTRFLSNQANPTKDSVPITYVQDTAGQSGDAGPARPRLSQTPLQLAKRSNLDRARSGRFSVGPSVAQIEPFMSSVNDEEEESVIEPSYQDYEQEVGKALWCTPQSFTQQPQTRTLFGEIRLPRGLQSTCTFPLFNILYCVELLAPATNAFVPDFNRRLPSSNKGNSQVSEAGQGGDSQVKDEHVYASQFVEVTTDARQDEPVPITFIKGPDPG